MKPVKDNDHLSNIRIAGYKSIAECTLKMGCLNVLIGANGAGKSNFIGFFRFLTALLDKRLQHAIAKAGGPDSILHFGRKSTEYLYCEIKFQGLDGAYDFQLEPSVDNRLFFGGETVFISSDAIPVRTMGHYESAIDQYTSHGSGNNRLDSIIESLKKTVVYHFHDTSDSAKVKQTHRINDNDYLREDGANLAAFLFRLKNHHASHYKRIIKTIQMVAPFFGDFHLRPTVDNGDYIQLEWTEREQDVPFKASELSDGTLRFILLATVLLQPEEFMPSSIIIDEPELGLHPYAINVLASLIKSASEEHQLIISTQSVELVNEFDAEDLIVVDKVNSASTFKRLDLEELSVWLSEYSLGDLWKKNLLGGRPQR